MPRMMRWMVLPAMPLLVASACGTPRDAQSPPSADPVPATISAHAVDSQGTHDADRAIAGAGLPNGYHAVFDRADAKPNELSYAPAGAGRWDVRTGPAHLLYSGRDTTRYRFTASATIEQMDRPQHPEAVGLFWGGAALNDPAKLRYIYFLVRGDGRYMVKVRQGAAVRTITDWTAHPGIPSADSAGHALYGIRVVSDSTRATISVNGVPVTTVAATVAPFAGIAGVRINHNLHVIVTPVSIVR